LHSILITLAVLASVLTGTGMQPASATPAPSVSQADCLQAYHHSRGAVAQNCREAGWTIRPRLVVGPHGVVRMSHLPHCRYEDGSGTASACTWNVGHRIDGNGIGAAYWIGNGNRDHTHYVWSGSPLRRGWHWATSADRMASGMDRTCIVRNGTTVTSGLVARCAGGNGGRTYRTITARWDAVFDEHYEQRDWTRCTWVDEHGTAYIRCPGTHKVWTS